jgi:hypothetical protein
MRAEQPPRDLPGRHIMDYDQDERFIRTDEFDDETMQLMAELGI